MKTSIRHRPSFRTLTATALLLGLVACAAPRPEAAATAELQPTRGNTASGMAWMSAPNLGLKPSRMAISAATTNIAVL